MNIKCLYLVILLGFFSAAAYAEEKSIQDQITEVKEMIKTREQTNQQLKDDIAARDQEVAELKQKIKELEEKIGVEGQ